MKISSSILFSIGLGAVVTLIVPYWQESGSVVIQTALFVLQLAFLAGGVLSFLAQDAVVLLLYQKWPAVWEQIGRPRTMLLFGRQVPGNFPQWDTFYKLLKATAPSGAVTSELRRAKVVYSGSLIVSAISGVLLVILAYRTAG